MTNDALALGCGSMNDGNLRESDIVRDAGPASLPLSVCVTFCAETGSHTELRHVCSGGLRRSAQPGGSWQLEGWLLFSMCQVSFGRSERPVAPPVWLVARRSSSAKPSWLADAGRKGPVMAGGRSGGLAAAATPR